MSRLHWSTSVCGVWVAGVLAGGGDAVAQTVSSRMADRDWIASRYFSNPSGRGAWQAASSVSALGGVATSVASDGFDYRPLLVAGVPSGVNAVPGADTPGARVDANTTSSAYYGVPAIFVNKTSGTDIFCTGVAISARYVLTAAHCLDFSPVISASRFGDGVSDIAANRVSARFNGTSVTSIAADSVTIHPNFTGFSNPSLNDDIAILHLSADIPVSIPVYKILPSAILSPVNDKFRIDFVGYGRSGTGATGFDAVNFPETLTTKRVGANLVESGGNNDDAGGPVVPEVFRYDFEPTITGSVAGETPPHFGAGDNYSWYQGDATKNVYNEAGGIISRTLGNGVESLSGPGDSGGPVFVKDGTGSLFLAGLTTFEATGLASVAGGYGSIGGGVWLGGYESFIESTTGVLFAEAGEFVPEPRETASGIALALGGWAWARRRGFGTPVRPAAVPPTSRVPG